jgi:hypothetical protein
MWAHVDTVSERNYGYPYETFKGIVKAFEENGQITSKHRGGVQYPILQDEHIQWLVERFHAYLDITIESLHRKLHCRTFYKPQRDCSIWPFSYVSPCGLESH